MSLSRTELCTPFEKLPWPPEVKAELIAKIEDKIGTPNLIKENLSLANALSLRAGIKGTINGVYIMHGHFYDEMGYYLGDIHPNLGSTSPKKIIPFLRMIFLWLWRVTSFNSVFLYENTIQEAASKLEDVDEISYIILYGDDSDYSGSKLYVFELPPNKKMSDLIGRKKSYSLDDDPGLEMNQ